MQLPSDERFSNPKKLAGFRIDTRDTGGDIHTRQRLPLQKPLCLRCIQSHFPEACYQPIRRQDKLVPLLAGMLLKGKERVCLRDSKRAYGGPTQCPEVGGTVEAFADVFGEDAYV